MFGPGFFHQAGGPSLEVTFVGSNSAVAINDTSHTFTSESIGAADANRVVLVTFGGGASSSTLTGISSVSIGGSSATLVESVAANNSGGFGPYSGIAFRSISTGTTANITVNTTDEMYSLVIGVYSIISPTATLTTVASTSEVYTSGGFAFVNNTDIATSAGGASFKVAALQNGSNINASGDYTKDMDLSPTTEDWVTSFSFAGTDGGSLSAIIGADEVDFDEFVGCTANFSQ